MKHIAPSFSAAIVASAFAFALACSNDTAFKSENARKPAKEPEPKVEPPTEPPAEPEEVEAPEPAEPEEQDPAPPLVVDDDASGAPVVEEPQTDEPPPIGETSDDDGPKTEARSQSFPFGEEQDKYDYVLVMDNSVSMNAIAANVKNAFKAILAQPDVFPADALMAVMSTMTGNEADLAKTGKGINRYTGIDAEPGFLDFIYKGAIQNYKAQVNATRAGKWPLDGCDQKWFKPGDKDATGAYCLDAALQITASAVGAEPGIHAFKQILQKNAGKALFRPNAIVNVIFVSDTHDPGVGNADLLASIPSYSEIRALADKSNSIQSLRFHALAPEQQCAGTGEGVHTKSYYKIAADSNGSKADVCTLVNYGDFLKKTILESKAKEPVFMLERPASEIVKVTVDGVEVKDYQLSATKDSITIPSLDSNKKSTVTIDYRTLTP